jgi:hypothetical protein
MRLVFLLLAAVLVLPGLSLPAAYAAGPSMDTPTAAALMTLRSNAADLVASLSNNKGVQGAEVTASYDDHLRNMPSQRLNTVMIVKIRAEQAAWTQMDPTSRALIKNFFATAASRQ